MLDVGMTPTGRDEGHRCLPYLWNRDVEVRPLISIIHDAVIVNGQHPHARGRQPHQRPLATTSMVVVAAGDGPTPRIEIPKVTPPFGS
ncbi:hypothetical protein CDL15_Pgr003902 [Punica granatum]|uniref:Uncharacterized protein n=1 Tax=Punica granatum TaxID=22663 RepID=A0A218WRE3_PUNGR|nr:hypothetical protein CDL15_Pgr003902 [Punica granatum]